MTDTKHTDSVETHESIVYEAKQHIQWDYSYYVSREQSVNGYWKRVSSIDEIPPHAISSYRTHPVEEPDNLFLFRIYKYLLANQQQVEEAVRAERSRIYGRLAQMKSVYETMDTGSALVALLGEDIIREVTPNHQD